MQESKTSRRYARKALALLLLCGAAGACGDEVAAPSASEFRAGSGGSCEVAEDPEAVRESFEATLFPDSATDEPLFCALAPQSGECMPSGSHLSGVVPFSGPIPAESVCLEASGQTLLRCDRYAKHLITRGLDEGSLIELLRGVTRMQDVMENPAVPAYYRSESSNNIFASLLAELDVDPKELGACTEGSDDDGYECLMVDKTAPNRRTIRALLELLDQHNGVLVRAGELEGAADREEQIFASSMAPMATHMARNEQFAPSVGPGVQRVQALAKVFALRMLDGTAGSTTEDELAYFLSMPGYEADGPGSEHIYAGMGLLGAQATAFGWDAQRRAPKLLDLQMTEDLNEFFATLRLTGDTATVLGRCDLTAQLSDIWLKTASSNLIGATFTQHQFIDPHFLTNNVLDLWWLYSMWSAANHEYIESCQMHQELVAVTLVEYDTVHNVDPYVEFGATDCAGVPDEWVDWDGNTATILSCDCTETDWDQLGGGSGRCENATLELEYSESYTRWLDYGDSLDAGETLDETLAVTITKEKVKEAYNVLLSSEDNGIAGSQHGEIYDYTNDGWPDLHHNEDAGVAVSILETGVGWKECQEELALASSTYSVSELDEIECDPSDSVDGNTVDSDCVNTSIPGPTIDPSPRDFIPYAIATRVCPEYTAKLNGVLDSSFELNECATPWSFTQAVQYFLENDWTPTANVEAHPEYGSDVKPLAMEFSQEALLLTQPVAAMMLHRADFASVAGNVPGAVSGGNPNQTTIDNWYADNNGLAVVDDMLATGEEVMGNGLDLYTDFANLDVWGEEGTAILPRLFAGAYGKCTSGQTCEVNNKRHTRALSYRRVRDAVETYNRLASERMEVQRRRLDGMVCFDDDGLNGYDRCGSCIVAEDITVPPDGIEELVCDDTLDLDGDGTSDCIDECAYFDVAESLSTEGADRLMNFATAVYDQSLSGSLDGDEIDYVRNAAKFARSVSWQLEQDFDLMLGGVDWLGYRAGLWVPGVAVDPTDQIFDVTDDLDERIAALEAMLANTNYDSFISSYLTQVTQLQDWADEVDDTQTQANNTVESYCSGGINGCKTDWDSTYEMVDAINTVIVDEICGREIKMSFLENNVVATDTFVVGPPPADCDDLLISPDIDALMAQTGELPVQAAAMNATLAETLVAVQDISAYFTLMEQNNAARAALAQIEEDRAAVENKIENILDGVTCGLAAVGATAVTIFNVACTGVTAGVCTTFAAPTTTAAWVGTAATCATAFNNESIWFPNAPTKEEVQRAYAEYGMTLDINSEAYTVTTKIQALLGHYARYEQDIVQFKTLVAAMVRAAAYDDELFVDVVNSSLFDPAHQMFEEESLGAMKATFNEAARRARDIHHVVQYDVGQGIAEGSDFEISPGVAYHFPRLGEVTVLQTYGGSFTTAYQDLQTSGGASGVGNASRSMNLVAYASLLKHVHTEFSSIYQDRQESGAVFIGSSSPGVWGTDSDGDGNADPDEDLNPGEASFLGDSPFYDPRRYVDEVGVGGVPCPAGTVDLADYCSAFDNGDPVDDGTCFWVGDLSVSERYSLAYLDHMTKAPGVELFTCYSTFESECREYDEMGLCIDQDVFSPYITVADPGPDGLYTYSELGGVSNSTYDTTDTTYVAAQTRVVRKIIDRFELERGTHDNIDSDDIEIRPGTYVWMVNMSESHESNGYSGPGFDPEIHLTTGEAPDTISEQLTGLALLCTDPIACADDYNGYDAEVMFMGDGYLGSRCEQRDTFLQQRVPFQMEPDLVSVPAQRAIAPATFVEDAEALLGSAAARDTLGAQPLHTNSWIVTLRGHSDHDGDQLYDEHGVPTAWALYRHIPGASADVPRLRIATQYSYYSAGAHSGDFEYNVRGLLECHEASDAEVCVSGTCN